MTKYSSALPNDNAALRSSIYEGQLFHVGPTEASSALVTDVWNLLKNELGLDDPGQALDRTSEAEFFGRIGRVRKALFVERKFHDHVFDVIEACGFDPSGVAFDPVRLRVVAHKGHENERAAPVYYAHRDTWFSLSQSVIAWWIALHDIPQQETYVVYPDWFRREIANDSEKFNYNEWRVDPRDLKVGWQDRNAGKEVHYCGVNGEFEGGEAVPLSAKKADNVLFSGHHLHQTLGHSAGHTRYSLDFRMVHLGDHEAQRGPPNVDNRSIGSATLDYVRR